MADGNDRLPAADALLPRGSERWRRYRTPPGAALALLLARVADQHQGPVLAILRDAHLAQELEADLRLVAPELPVWHVPDWETLPYDPFSPHPAVVGQRLQALARLPEQRRGVLVAPVATVLQRLPPRRFVAGGRFHWRVGGRLSLDAEIARLDACGYRRVGQVLEPGDFAVRGSLLDVYPMGADRPYRIELLDDEIDSLRSFDVDSQRSEHKVEAIELMPAREVPVDPASLKALRERLLDRFDLDPRQSGLYQQLKAGQVPPGVEYYLPLFFDATESLFDYLAGEPLVVVGEGSLRAAAGFLDQASGRYEARRHDRERPILPVAELFLDEQELRQQLNARRRLLLAADGEPAPGLSTVPAPVVPLHQKGAPAAEALKALLASGTRVLIAADSLGRREALREWLASAGLHPDDVPGLPAFLSGTQAFAITAAPLSDGFALPGLVVLGERQLYGERVRQERRRARARTRDPEAILRDLGELSIGSPVVHVDHGVGRYEGLVHLETGGIAGEYLKLRYAGGDLLYVPVARLELVSRYTGSAPEQAPLHSLSSDAWEKARRKAAEKVHDVAAELLEIHARRMARGGSATAVDHVALTEFAAGFRFEETPDQLAAIEAVLADIEAPRAMDRVVCGDVGFGKTEVALRAAFAVAHAGRQVAVLVPTTLLAEQHHRNFADRFADWPLCVEVLSRFRSKAEVTGLLARVAEGRVDVIIGTHRLLAPDVRFKDLGLIIVDEEQRFGVRHKEQLKQLRAEVDLLTLTATPIPRTLNMALAGLRELSIIATPPEQRLAVKTVVCQWDPPLLKEAIGRELARGGQVYYLHNDVASIERAARELSEIVPEARIQVAHGQMPDSELERIMADFYRQRANVLVASTIIESGIDVPTANTMIIQRADRFGLAQLHQLRGRVGRSHHRAYCYLLVPPPKAMTADAAKRLEAIAALEELGAGFTLATHDLEIRGAGELLGEAQSGAMHEVGFSLYTEMLERAVRAIQAGRLPDLDRDRSASVEVDLHAAALIPEDFLPDVHQRLVLYKRLASSRDQAGIDELKVEMVDRFGLLPPALGLLFSVQSLKLRCQALGVQKLDLGAAGGSLRFAADAAIEPIRLVRLLQARPRDLALDGPQRLKVRLPMADAAARLRVADELLTALGAPV